MTTPLVSVAVNNTTIPQVIYKGQPVLTASAIAAVHGIQPINIRSNFNNNRKYFTEGVDYFPLTAVEAMRADFRHISKASHPYVKNFNLTHFLYSGHGIVLFTKSGYLKLTKSMTDAKAWAVHQTLINTYFQHEEVQAVLKETGGVYVSEEAMFDDDDLLIAKALKAASLKIERYEARLSEMQPKVESYDRFLSVEGSVNATQAATVLGHSSGRALNSLMKLFGFFDRRIPTPTLTKAGQDITALK